MLSTFRIWNVSGTLPAASVRIAELDAKWERRSAESDAKWERHFAALSERMAGFEARIVKWMFVMWIGTIGTLIALIKF